MKEMRGKRKDAGVLDEASKLDHNEIFLTHLHLAWLYMTKLSWGRYIWYWFLFWATEGWIFFYLVLYWEFKAWLYRRKQAKMMKKSCEVDREMEGK